MTVKNMCGGVATLDQHAEAGTSLTTSGDVVADTIRDRGLGQYGCIHYKRRCKIIAPCCGEVSDCRHCHNEAQNAKEIPGQARHDIQRHLIKSVICSLCSTEQEVRQDCKNCGVRMGGYFCDVCNFFDDQVEKEHFHCDKCGICRVGGRKNFFHCDRCGCCYTNSLRNSHKCVENSMHHNCPVCFEFLFDSLRDISVLKDCGHTIHTECLKDLQKHRYTCPICCKSMVNMTSVWEQMDIEVSATPMPEPYASQTTAILCNDCGATAMVPFHVVGHKCPPCGSYNTRQIQ